MNEDLLLSDHWIQHTIWRTDVCRHTCSDLRPQVSQNIAKRLAKGFRHVGQILQKKELKGFFRHETRHLPQLIIMAKTHPKSQHIRKQIFSLYVSVNHSYQEWLLATFCFFPKQILAKEIGFLNPETSK